jgi:carbamoyltransferase
MSNVIGVSAHFHDAAACLLRDGTLIAAAEEERFTRQKHDPQMPKRAFAYCLSAGGLSIADVDCIAYYEDPVKKLGRQLWMLAPGLPRDPEVLARCDARLAERDIREVLGFEGHIEYVDHHLAHAASAYLYSGYDESAILTVDGVGEWDTTTYGRGRGDRVEILESVQFPDSLGLLYSAITGYLGFEVNEGEYKVMGLAPYGRPTYEAQMRTLIVSPPGGQYRLDLRYFDFLRWDRMHAPALVDLFGLPARVPGAEILQAHRDVARSLQVILEEVLLQKVAYLHDRTGSEQLCMAGGVALNCVANGRILRDGPFRRLFVQPAASDAGGCLGAAAIAAQRLARGASGPGATTPDARPGAMEDVCLGPSFSADDIDQLLTGTGWRGEDYRDREAAMLDAVAERLANGEVVGWFHGRMEFGPRALGARSILADPRRPDMRDRINAVIKKRESFRPFAPAVLASRCREHFDLDHSSRFMLETCQVISPLALPAITHVDGSARVQTVDPRTSPRFARLLEAFERRTGCPLLLNTSFNMKDEPIVCTPVDAIVCFIRSEMDVLVLEDFVMDRAALSAACQILLHDVRLPSKAHVVSHETYALL